MSSPSRATLLLQRYGAGDRAAGDELLPLLYSELRNIAASHMRPERREHTLQPTALVHEAWIRLMDVPAEQLEGKAHFLSLAARAMRHVLVDHARSRAALKRGGDRERIPLDAAIALYEGRDVDVRALDEALEKLEGMDEQLARIVELRFFGGMTNEEVARAEQTSLRSVERAWSTARAWLRDALSDS